MMGGESEEHQQGRRRVHMRKEDNMAEGDEDAERELSATMAAASI